MNTVIDKTSADFTAIKQRQQATWASGDYAVIGTTLPIVRGSTMNRSQIAAPLPDYARRSAVSRIPMMIAAALVSTCVLGSVLGLFEMQARDATLVNACVPGASAGSVVASKETNDERHQPVVARAASLVTCNDQSRSA